MVTKKQINSIIALHQSIGFFLMGFPALSRRLVPLFPRVVDSLLRGSVKAWSALGVDNPNAIEAIHTAGSTYVAVLLLVPQVRSLGLGLAVLSHALGMWILHCGGWSVWLELVQAGLAGLALACK